MRRERDGSAAPDWSGADLCPPLCPLHLGRDCRRGRHRRSRSRDADETELAPPRESAKRAQRPAQRQRAIPWDRSRKPNAGSATPILGPQTSAELRDHCSSNSTILALRTKRPSGRTAACATAEASAKVRSFDRNAASTCSASIAFVLDRLADLPSGTGVCRNLQQIPRHYSVYHANSIAVSRALRGTRIHRPNGRTIGELPWARI
jgi:hypothetical protein